MVEKKTNEDARQNEHPARWCGHMWHRDRLDAIGWAAFLIWGALVLLAETTKFSTNFSWWNGWGVFFAGVGIIVIVGTVIRLLLPQYKRSAAGGFIFGFILLAIGLGGWAWIWPLAL
ncbi:MAG: hypothetical protein JSV98_11235, partial [candidate division WOR-3 bacterium]